MIETLEFLLLFSLRLGIPLLITYLFSRYLKYLDAKWRLEGLEHAAKQRLASGQMPDVRCWEIRGCSPETRSGCPAYLRGAACWEVNRVNGRIDKKCTGCRVINQALAPAGI